MKDPFRTPPGTPVGQRLRELRDFVRESHQNGGVIASAKKQNPCESPISVGAAPPR